MKPTHRAALALAGTLLLALGAADLSVPRAGAFPPPRSGSRPPVFKPPVMPPFGPPVTGGSRGGTVPGTFTGGSFTPGASFGKLRIPTRTPAQYEFLLRSTAKTSPRETLHGLRSSEGRALSDAVRLGIARELARSLAVRVEGLRDPVARVAEINRAWAEAVGLPKTERAPLDRLHDAAHRAMLGEAVKDIAAIDSGRLGEAGAQADRWGRTLGSNRPGEPGLAGDHAAVESAILVVAEVGAKARTVGHLEAALEGKSGWAKVDAGKLPDGLGKQAEVLRGVAGLKDAAAAKGAPDVVAVKRAMEKLGDLALAKEAALDLAAKALIDGHVSEFNRLMPEGASAEQAAQVLRDLKAMALGEGKVETWAARQSSSEAARPPPGVEPLVPEGARAGWKPPVKEKGTAGLPALERVGELGQKTESAAKEGAKTEKARLLGEGAKARTALDAAQARVMAPVLAERKRFAGIEYRLGQRLNAGQRMRVRDLLDEGKQMEEILPLLKKPVLDEDEAYLADVAAALGRALSDDEKQQARRLRREGRRAAEVAELLRN